MSNAKTKANKSKTPKIGENYIPPANSTGGLPPSYYRGLDKKYKPPKDKNGKIIPQ